MRVDGLKLREGTKLDNLTCPSGNEFPTEATEGELFRLKGHAPSPFLITVRLESVGIGQI